RAGEVRRAAGVHDLDELTDVPQAPRLKLADRRALDVRDLAPQGRVAVRAGGAFRVVGRVARPIQRVASIVGARDAVVDGERVEGARSAGALRHLALVPRRALPVVGRVGDRSRGPVARVVGARDAVVDAGDGGQP